MAFKETLIEAPRLTKAGKVSKRTGRFKLRRVVTDVLFLLPALGIFTGFFVYPMLSSFYYAFTDWNGLNPEIKFVGLDNFKDIFTDRFFWSSLQNTIIFAVFATIVQNTIGLALALCVENLHRLFKFLRVVYLFPVVISSLAVGYIWSYMYSPTSGVINNFLTDVGLANLAQDWLGDRNLALMSVIVTSIWQSAGYSMVIFLAGLQAVPTEMLDAASIDGASYWKRFVNVTFPLIAPAFTINTVLTLIGSLKVFDIIFVMTKGGPAGATESLSLRLYTEAFTENNMGYATAIGIILFIMIFGVSIISLRFLRKREVEL